MFSVVANLADDCDYIAHWEGGRYDDFDEAFKRWDEWFPPFSEVMASAIENDANAGRENEYQLQIGLWDEASELEWWNREFTVKDSSFLKSAYN